ncbi:ArdC-like ssDNA-binding domain-containing protein [Billgrantia sp. LNSP4103-1]|uniref:ArdC-like ssDNA-binding domain-containing protein n=1 Tax=Billgrantia sp. LNSP4103-1 TaxID=3410266 RepID=UPI00403F6E98
MTRNSAAKTDIYTRITDKIITDLEQGVRPWIKLWNAEHAAGRITKPLRHNGQPYNGINILMLWGAAAAIGYSAPIWMTFRQAKELGGHVRKGEKGSRSSTPIRSPAAKPMRTAARRSTRPSPS